VFYVFPRRCDSDRSDLDFESSGRCIKEPDCRLACEFDPSHGSADNAENSKRILFTSNPVRHVECTYGILCRIKSSLPLLSLSYC